MRDLIRLRNADYEGWQYWVYYHDGIVKKYPKSFGSVLVRIAISNPSMVAKPHRLVQATHETICRRENSVRGIKMSDIDRSLLAKVSFDDGCAYQDQVKPIHSVLDTLDTDSQRQLITQWSNFLVRCWREGFGERSYNLLDNYGLSDDNFVLIDFGELTFDKELVKNDVRERRWLEQWWFTQLQPELQEKLKDSLESRITPKTVETNWDLHERSPSDSGESWHMKLDKI